MEIKLVSWEDCCEFVMTSSKIEIDIVLFCSLAQASTQTVVVQRDLVRKELMNELWKSN